MANTDEQKSVHISAATHRLMKQYAAQEGGMIKELIDQAIHAFLRQKGFIK